MQVRSSAHVGILDDVYWLVAFRAVGSLPFIFLTGHHISEGASALYNLLV